jgi:hypothetical protein
MLTGKDIITCSLYKNEGNKLIMKTIATLLGVLLLCVSCGRSPQPASSQNTSSTQPSVLDLEQFTTAVRQVVQEADRDVAIGQKPVERIRDSVSSRFQQVKVISSDTNLQINVNCGDPIYHVTIQIMDGRIGDVSVTLTPIDPEF